MISFSQQSAGQSLQSVIHLLLDDDDDIAISIPSYLCLAPSPGPFPWRLPGNLCFNFHVFSLCSSLSVFLSVLHLVFPLPSLLPTILSNLSVLPSSSFPPSSLFSPLLPSVLSLLSPPSFPPFSPYSPLLPSLSSLLSFLPSVLSLISPPLLMFS